MIFSSESGSFSVKDEVSSSTTTSSSSSLTSVAQPQRRREKKTDDDEKVRIRIDVHKDHDDEPDFHRKSSSKYVTTYEQVLPKQPEFPAKPTCSFIRTPPNRVIPKSDPVKLYHSYKEHWDKTRFPGEESAGTKQLRWTVREWMMGHRE